MAHLSDQAARGTHAVASWAAGLWHAVIPCSAIMLLLCGWTFISSREGAASNSGSTADLSLSQEMENTLFAAADVENQPADKVW
jgi:hypothetical protein